MDVVIPTSLSSGSLIRASTATYHNSLGVITTSPANNIRINYNPSDLLALPSVLIEAGTTNYSYSENFLEGNGLFTITGATTDYNSLLAPDGTITAEKLVEDTSTGVHGAQFQSGITAPAGTFCTYSIFAKASERSVVEIKLISGVDTWSYDLIAGTVSGSGANSTAIITNEGSGWYRCKITVNDPFAITFVNVNMKTSGSDSYAGDGVSGVYLWGQQSEVGTQSSSYMPSVYTFVGRTSSATYVNSSGVLATATSGNSRLNYNPDNLVIPPKLLLEPAATNICLQSQTFTTSPWVQHGTQTTTGGPVVSPSGATNATVLNDTDAAVLSNNTQPIAVPNNSNTYVFSLFIKKTSVAATFPAMELVFSGGTTTGCSVSFNTNTGVATVNGSVTTFNPNPVTPKYLKIDSYGTYWRVSIGCSNNNTGNTTLTAIIYYCVTSGTTWDATLTGNTTIWGAQVEVASVGFGSTTNKNTTRTSYIATTTASVSRSPDTYTTSNGVRAAETYTRGLLYSNIPENDFPVWNSGTTYAIETGSGANSVIYQHNRYASLRASNTNFNPATDTSSPPYWLLLGPTNQYNMFDQSPGTQTVGTVGGHILVAVAIGALATLSFINMVADTVTIKIYSAYDLQYTQVIDFTGGSSGVPITDYTLTGLPTFPDGYVVLDIYSAASAPACGNFVTGTRYYLGSTGLETPATIGIIDYSIKSTDSFGNPTLTKRGYAKRMTTTSLVDRTQVDLVSRILSANRATPCVWNGNSSMASPTSNLETSLILYGFYQDWEISMTNPNQSYLTMTVQSLI